MVSCDDDDATIEENDIPDGTHVVNYSVQVIPSSLNGKVAGLANVKVTVSQNGTTTTKTTNETGIVTFEKLKQGYVSVYVKGPEGFLSYNTTDELECYSCDFDENDSEQIEFYQRTFTLPRLGATVKGRVFADLDFNGGAPAAGETLPTSAVVIAKISSVYEPNVFKTNPTSDGTFQFTNLPEGILVTFDIDFKKVDNTPNPTVEHNFYLDGVSTTPNINNPHVFGNINALYN